MNYAVLVISTLTGLMSCTGTKPQPNAKAVSSVAESMEHRFAVRRYDANLADLAKLKKEHAENEAGLADVLAHHDESSTRAGKLLQESDAQVRMGRIVAAAIQTSKRQLDVVDSCLKTYQDTIDKKQSDLTTRELDQISECRSLKSYPPEK
jgi:hypothetical protein